MHLSTISSVLCSDSLLCIDYSFVFFDGGFFLVFWCSVVALASSASSASTEEDDEKRRQRINASALYFNVPPEKAGLANLSI